MYSECRSPGGVKLVGHNSIGKETELHGEEADVKLMFVQQYVVNLLANCEINFAENEAIANEQQIYLLN